MLATRRQRFKMISVRNLLHRAVPVSLVVFVLLLMLTASVSSFGFDSANSCNPNGGAAKQSRRGRAQMMAAIPCDLTQQVYCHLPGAAYPWHAVRRFVHENQGLMKRMYGDVKHISVLRDELLGNEIDNADVAMAAERYSREGNRRSAKFLKNRRPGDEDYMGAGRPTNEAPHFRPVTTTTTTRTSTTTTTEAAPTDSLEKNESSFEQNEHTNESLNEPSNESQNDHENEPANESQSEHENDPWNETESEPKNESVSEPKNEPWKGPINSTLVETQSAREPEQDVEDLAANSVYEIIPPLGDGLAAHLTGDNIQIIASPQLPLGGLNASTTTTTTTKKVEPSPTNLTFTTTSSRTTPTTTTPSSTPTEPTNSSMHTTTASPSSSSSAAAPATSSPASPFRRRQRPAMSYKQHHNLLQQQHQQHYQQQQQQQSQMLHLKISSSLLRDSPSTRIKLNESERIAVKGGGGVASASLSPPGSTAATSTTTSTTTAASSSSTSTTTTTTQLTMNKRKPIKPIEAAAVAATAPSAFKGDHRFRKPAPTQSATPSATAGTTGGTTTTRPVLKEGQLFQDTMKQEVVAAPAIPVTNMRGVNACPVKEEVVAPFWANNTRGEVLALLNLYPFEQYVHWEKCTHEHKQMYCRDGCRCEQQYRLHRLLAYDPHNECRGIFSDWFRFPSCCICKCYNIPMEFRATSRSPRSDQSGLYDTHQEAAEAPPSRHPIETAEAEVKRAIYEHATEDWYRRRDEWHDDAEEGVEADPMGADGGDEFGELF